MNDLTFTEEELEAISYIRNDGLFQIAKLLLFSKNLNEETITLAADTIIAKFNKDQLDTLGVYFDLLIYLLDQNNKLEETV